jgi:1-acyl-sn-glycerol-3-phosphate acyltransferase
MFDVLGRMGPWFWFGWRVLRGLLTLYNRLEAVGIENVPLKGGSLIGSNHISHLDPPAVGCCIPRKARFVAKDELFHQFFLSWYLPSVGVIPIKRGVGGNLMLDKAVEAIEKGEIVVLFPEGTRSRTGFPGKARSGIIVLAARTGVPIMPARISGSYDCMPPGSLFPAPGKIQVAFGKPITYKPGEIDLNNREQVQAETHRLMETIMSLPGWVPRKAKAPDGTEEASNTAISDSAKS